MIIYHKKFDLWGHVLIETLGIKPPFRMSVNFPQQSCFIYYKKGKAFINSPTEQVLVESDESVVLNCGTYFANLLEYPDGDFYEILVFHLHPDVLKKLYRQEFPKQFKKEQSGTFIHKMDSREIIKRFAENLLFYFEHPELVNEDILELKIKELILILLQGENSGSVKGLLSTLFTSKEVTVKEIVQQHLFSNISVNDLAELANMTPATFNRKFHELFNDSPASYIKGKRLEWAKELLRVSTLTISEVAFKTGFNDVPHFSRSFKQQFKSTPASFRALSRKN